MSIIELTLPYPPTANLYWRTTKTGHTYVSPEAKAFKRTVALLAKAKGVRPFTGPAVVSIDVYRPRKIGDLDNTIKVLLDALRGFVFDDDRQVVEIHARRHDDASRPRAEVTIAELTPEITLEAFHGIP